MERNSSKKIVLCGIFAALTGVCAMISIPFGAVPINLVHISVFFTAWILGPYLAMISQIIYILMGIVGLPVFSGFTAGLGHILGPTGGFIFSYPIVAFLSGYIFKIRKCKFFLKIIIGILIGWGISYIMGTTYYSFVTMVSVGGAFGICVLPFLIGDVFKSIFVIILIMRLGKIKGVVTVQLSADCYKRHLH